MRGLGINARQLAKWMRRSSKECWEQDFDGVYHWRVPYTDYAFAIGFLSGYDPTDTDDGRVLYYHSRKQPSWVVNVKLAIWNPADFCEFEYCDMPYNKETGDVWDTSTSLGPNTDFHEIAKWLLRETRAIVKEFGREFER